MLAKDEAQDGGGIKVVVKGPRPVILSKRLAVVRNKQGSLLRKTIRRWDEHACLKLHGAETSLFL
jgi:hypothetical protein